MSTRSFENQRLLERYRADLGRILAIEERFANGDTSHEDYARAMSSCDPAAIIGEILDLLEAAYRSVED